MQKEEGEEENFARLWTNVGTINQSSQVRRCADIAANKSKNRAKKTFSPPILLKMSQIQ